MPHLNFFDRFWRISNDDFSVPALCSIVYRVLWTTLLIIALSQTYSAVKSCENVSSGDTIVSYLFVSIFAFSAAVLCELRIFVISFRGTVIESDERNGMNIYLVLKVVIGILQLILAIIGAVILGLGSRMPCNGEFEGSSLIHAFLFVVVISQFIDASTIVCCCYLFSTHMTAEEYLKYSEPTSHPDEQDESLLLKKWEERCRNLTQSLHFFSCNLLGGGNINEGFDGMANILATFFHHNGFLDVVPSDVVVGLILVRLAQQRRRLSQQLLSKESDIEAAAGSPGLLYPQKNETDEKKSTLEDKRELSSALNLRTRMLSKRVVYANQSSLRSFSEMELIARCSVFATAAYSHILSVYMQPCSGVCRVCCTSMCGPLAALTKDACSCLPCGHCVESTLEHCMQGQVVGDNACGLNRAGVHTLVHRYTRNSELGYASFFNDTNRKPFVVILDHEKECIVLAVRGTLSLEDCVTDVLCEPTELTAAGEKWGFDGSGRHAHSGFLKVALFLRQEIESQPELKRILSRDRSTSSSTPTKQVELIRADSPGNNNVRSPLKEKRDLVAQYSLVVTGHSLGAGVAVLLTLLMKNSGYPECRPYVTSVVYNNDLICRTSFLAIDNLRNELLDCLTRVKTNKYEVFKTAIRLSAAKRRICRGWTSSQDSNSGHQHKHDITPHVHEYDALDACRYLMFEEGEEPDSKFKATVLNLKRTVQDRAAKSVAVCELFIPGKILHFVKPSQPGARHEIVDAHMDDMREIKVSLTMGSDHLPDRYFLAAHDVLHS
eukprot:gene23752-32137_t